MGVNSRVLTAISLGVAAALIAAAGGLNVEQGPDCYNNEAEDTILFAHVMFRHGNRTPAKPTFPSDRYADYSFYPAGWGMLTNAGKMKSYENGRFLRHRYGRFLGDVLDSEVMQVKSTDLPRTKNTASLVAAGLWPTAGPNRWGESLGSMWEPVPLEVLPKKYDNLLHCRRAPCPAYKREYERVLQSREVRELLNSFSKVREYLSKHTGMDVQNPTQGYNIYQALIGQKEFGLELPDWAEHILPRLKEFAMWFPGLSAYNEKLQKMRAGVVLREITANNIAAATNSLQPKGRKIVLYSGHDTNLSALLLALGVFNYKMPPYGTMFMIELHRIPRALQKNAVQDSQYQDAIKPFAQEESLNNLHQYGLKMFLRNSTWHDPYPLTLPNCDTFCPLDRFVKLTSHMVIHDWEADCE